MNFKKFLHQLLAKIEMLTRKKLIGMLVLIARLITVRIQYLHTGRRLYLGFGHIQLALSIQFLS